jgi:cysteine desulfurase
MEGGGQEHGLRSGTLNVPGIVGFGEAARRAAEALRDGEGERIRGLRDRLLAALRALIPGLEVNGDLERRLPGNLNVSIEGISAETVLLSLGDDIALSSGAACAEAGGKGSHVLRALGLSDARVYSAIRIGIGRHNTEGEIDEVARRLAEAVAAARSRAAHARA